MAGFLTEVSTSAGVHFFTFITANGVCTLHNGTQITGWVWIGEYTTTKEKRGGYIRNPVELMEINGKVFGTLQEFKPVTEPNQKFKIMIGNLPYNCEVKIVNPSFPSLEINSAILRPPAQQAQNQQQYPSPNNSPYNPNNLQIWMNQQGINLANPPQPSE